MEDKFIRLNTVLMPPDEITSQAISLSRDLIKNYEVYFTLDGKNYHPHITLYSPEYPVKNLNKIFNVVESIASKFNKIHCHIIKAKEIRGFISLEIEMIPEIKQLHEELVSKLNPLREGHIMKKYISNHKMDFSDEKVENIKKYGYPNSMFLYHPHLSIIRFKDEAKAREIIKTLEWPQKDFVVSNLGIYKMGEHGTCRELIKEFPFQD